MYELVEARLTNSKVIAEETNNHHEPIVAVIQKYESDFAEFGKVRFKIEPLESGQKADS